MGDEEINGVSRRCLIDTGAAVSIIPLELIRPAAEMTLPASASKLGMISGHTLNVVGTYNAEVRLGSWSAAHRFLVADISTDTILGADFLARHGIDILFRWEGCLRIPTGKWPITVPNATCPPSGPPHETPEEQPVFRVALADNVVFRPEQRVILALAELRDPRTGDMARVGNANLLLFETNLQLIEKCGIIPARALVDGSTGFIPVRLFNTGGPAKLYKGKRVGTVEIADTTEWYKLHHYNNKKYPQRA